MRLTFDVTGRCCFSDHPYLWWVRTRSAVDLTPKHLRISTMIRSVIVLALTAALMQPVLYKTSTYVSVVYLLDVSQSVAPAAIQKAMDWIQKTNSSGKPDHAEFVAFGSNSMAFDKVEDLKTVKVANHEGPGILDQSKSDLSVALDAAMRGFAPNHLKRVVLLSDGNENSGDMSTVLHGLQRENARLHHSWKLSESRRVDESVLAPPSVISDEQFQSK